MYDTHMCISKSLLCSQVSCMQVPNSRPTKDASANEKRVLQRTAIMKTVDALMKYPDISLETWGKVEAQLNARAASSNNEDPNRFNPQYKKIHRLPTYWMVPCMLHGRSSDRLQKGIANRE